MTKLETKLTSMKKIFYLLLLSFPFFKAKAAVYSTPGTGVNWTLTDLVSNSGGIVTFDGTNYSFTDSVTISTNDVFRIETNETVLFNAQVVFKINGTILKLMVPLLSIRPRVFCFLR